MDHKEQRAEGYYWVKRKGEWQIAFWFVGHLHYWTLGRSVRDYEDNDFEEIDENRIERWSEKYSRPFKFEADGNKID